VVAVGPTHLGCLRRAAELLESVLAQRLEELVARLRPVVGGRHERLVDEAREHVERRRRFGVDGFGGGQGEPALEDGEAREEVLLARVEERVAPVDHRAQRALAGDGGAGPR
jgi:hypothetical protein